MVSVKIMVGKGAKDDDDVIMTMVTKMTIQITLMIEIVMTKEDDDDDYVKK